MTDKTLDDGLSQVYLQISPNILESFPKFRPPVALYKFDENIAQVKLFHKAEERLGKDKQAEVADYAQDSLLFLLREDYKVYAQHLSQKLGLVLVEDDLSGQEVSEIFFLAFKDRMTDMLEQPKEASLKALVKDISILAEYLWTDPSRVDFLSKSLHKDYDLAVHSVNTMFIGLALFAMVTKGKMEKTTVLSLALGLALHDLGMVNVPKFIIDKEQYVVRRDRDSIEKHVDAGESMLKRLNITDATVMQCLLQHHERLDGSGYPQRLMNKSLSLAGRLCGLADSYCAIIAERPYHKPKSPKDAVVALMKDPKHYDPALSKLLALLVTKGFIV